MRLFFLKLFVILVGPMLALPASAQLQPLPIFQSKSIFTVDLPATAATVTSPKIDATAFGSMLIEFSSTCSAGVFTDYISVTIRGTNDRTLALGSYPILPIQNAIVAMTRVGAGYVSRLYEVQPLTSFLTLTLLQGATGFCSVKATVTLAPFTGLMSIQGSIPTSGNAGSATPVLIGGTGFFYSGAYSELSANMAGITSGGALFTTSMGGTYTVAREFLVTKPIPATPTLCTTVLSLPTLPFDTAINIKYTWVQNNGPDPIRCSVENTETTYNTCVNNGFVIPADGGNMSIEAAALLRCVVIGAADQVTGAATNVVIGYERQGYKW